MQEKRQWRSVLPVSWFRSLQILSGRPQCPIPDYVDPVLADIVRRLMTVDPDKRMTIEGKCKCK